MKTIKKVSVIFFIACITMAFTTKDTVRKESSTTYYYFAYATTGVNSDVYDKVWITPILKVTINDNTHYNITKSGLALQMDDYMEANYNLKGMVSGEGEVYEAVFFDKAKVTEYYRSTLKLYDKKVKINNFRYLKERR
jgi:hypothetical protein